MAENGRQRLTSWKEIASYMGRDVRTVLRWEKQRGLPIHRVPGATGRVVFAYTNELDTWVRGAANEPEADALDQGVPALIPESASPAGSSTERPRPWWRAAALPAAAIVVLAGGALWLMGAALGGAGGEIGHAVVTEAAVQATRPDGRVLWTYPLGRVVNRLASAAVVVDLNGDARADVAASIATSTDGAGPGTLLALDHRGRKLWEHQSQESLTFGTESFGPPWLPHDYGDLSAFSLGGQPFVAWTLHHHTWWPSMLAVVNGRGDRTATFVNSGWIRNVFLSKDGRYLLAGGISNARDGAAFAILDARQPGGTSPEDPDSKWACRNCPAGTPLRYFVIPWTDVIDPTLLGGRTGSFTSLPDGGIELRAVQSQNAEMFVDLTPSLEIKRRRIGDGFWLVHAQREREGLLKHSRETCPFRNGPTVLEWMPEQGWRELKP